MVELTLERKTFDSHGFSWWDPFPMDNFTGRWKEVRTNGVAVLWFEIIEYKRSFWGKKYPIYKWKSENSFRFIEVKTYMCSMSL